MSRGAAKHSYASALAACWGHPQAPESSLKAKSYVRISVLKRSQRKDSNIGNEVRLIMSKECFFTMPKGYEFHWPDGLDLTDVAVGDPMKYDKADKIWWMDVDLRGPLLFTFDLKNVFNFWSDYPNKLTPEQKKIFDQENPSLAEMKAGE